MTNVPNLCLYFYYLSALDGRNETQALGKRPLGPISVRFVTVHPISVATRVYMRSVMCNGYTYRIHHTGLDSKKTEQT